LATTFDMRFRVALDAAERVFAEKGYGVATMRDVAASAGLSIAGLYYYLPSKQRALFLICERALSALSDGLERALAATPVPEAQLRGLVHAHMAFITRRAEAYRALLHVDALDGADRAAIVELRRRYFARAADLVIAVQQEQPSAISTRVATAALFGMMNWTPMWHHVGDTTDAAHIADEMTTLFLRGVASTAAAELIA
jgi:TetR/AcrR family transcriptional regulator, cholesterol catabolism regulator